MQLTTANATVLYQLLYELRDGAMGRRTLVERTGITEMTTRTHLNKLRDAGWVKMEKAGTSLTQSAKRALAAYFDTVSAVHELAISDLTLYRANMGALLRGCAESFGKSLILRDAAVRAGAAGAVFLIRSDEGWMFSEEDVLLCKQYAAEAEELDRRFDSREGDLLAIVFAVERAQARRGLWNVIAEMIEIDFD